MKKIPKKNYIILFIIIFVTVALVFYVRGWYNTSLEYYAKNSAVKDVCSEINEGDISNYTVENQKFILYISSGMDSNVKGFENELKKLINKMDLSRDVLYLNLDTVDVNTFNYNLKSSFNYNDSLSNISDQSYPAFYVFSDGKVVSVLKNADHYNIKQIELLIKKWGFRND